MSLSDGAEEILETMWIGIEEKNQSSVSVDHIREIEKETHFDELVKYIDELVAKGMVRREKEQLTLTPDGNKEGRDTVRRHRLSERLFEDVLELKGELMNEAACKMEHILHRGIDETICTLLGHPQVCPHGKPIPPGTCCKEKRKISEKLVTTLADTPLNLDARIAYLHTNDPHQLQKLMAMGVLPGKPVRVLHRYPSFVFQVGHSQYAVDKDMAAGIFVRISQPKM